MDSTPIKVIESVFISCCRICSTVVDQWEQRFVVCGLFALPDVTESCAVVLNESLKYFKEISDFICFSCYELVCARNNYHFEYKKIQEVLKEMQQRTHQNVMSSNSRVKRGRKQEYPSQLQTQKRPPVTPTNEKVVLEVCLLHLTSDIRLH